jgi:hypothetical protein
MSHKKEDLLAKIRFEFGLPEGFKGEFLAEDPVCGCGCEYEYTLDEYLDRVREARMEDYYAAIRLTGHNWSGAFADEEYGWPEMVYFKCTNTDCEAVCIAPKDRKGYPEPYPGERCPSNERVPFLKPKA